MSYKTEATNPATILVDSNLVVRAVFEPAAFPSPVPVPSPTPTPETLFVVFTPSTVEFNYQRNSTTYPEPTIFTATNTSNTISCYVTLRVNPTYFVVSPIEFQLMPGESKQFSVSILNERINDFNDGQTTLQLEANVSRL